MDTALVSTNVEMCQNEGSGGQRAMYLLWFLLCMVGVFLFEMWSFYSFSLVVLGSQNLML